MWRKEWMNNGLLESSGVGAVGRHWHWDGMDGMGWDAIQPDEVYPLLMKRRIHERNGTRAQEREQ